MLNLKQWANSCVKNTQRHTSNIQRELRLFQKSTKLMIFNVLTMADMIAIFKKHIFLISDAISILWSIQFFPASEFQHNISLSQILAKFFGFKKFIYFLLYLFDLLSRLLFEGRRPFWCSWYQLVSKKVEKFTRI